MQNKSTKILLLCTFVISTLLHVSAFAADDSTSATDDSAAVEDTANPATADDSSTAATDSSVTTKSDPATKAAPATPAPTTTTTTITTTAATPAMKTVISDNVVNDEAVGGEKTVFTKDTNKVFVVVTTDQVKPGQVVKSIWIADDTNGAAPANYQIDEKSLDVGKDMNSDKNWVATFSLSKPTAGWPLGQYHVDIYVDKVLAKTIKFTVQ